VQALVLRLAGLAALAAAALAAPAASAASCPNTGLAREQVQLETALGRFRYTLERAVSSAEQACGLMYRESMPRGEGMAFPMVPPRQTGFWMENTLIPLDIIYVSPAGRVLNVVRGKPHSREVLESAGITGEVIELNAGEAARIGLKPGDRVRR
jgi:uncharacterized membrane protein (UPF0127 family)